MGRGAADDRPENAGTRTSKSRGKMVKTDLRWYNLNFARGRGALARRRRRPCALIFSQGPVQYSIVHGIRLPVEQDYEAVT